MCKMDERSTENFARRLDQHRRHQFSTQIPPGASWLRLVIKEHVVGAQSLDGALETHVMDEAPRLSPKIGRHAKGIVENLGNATHLKSLLSALTEEVAPRERPAASSIRELIDATRRLRQTLTAH